jgi:hypothetical protein
MLNSSRYNITQYVQVLVLMISSDKPLLATVIVDSDHRPPVKVLSALILFKVKTTLTMVVVFSQS